MDETLKCTSTPYQSQPGKNGNKGVLHKFPELGPYDQCSLVSDWTWE